MQSNPKTSLVIDEIHTERLRQMQNEGWSHGHDDLHTDGSIAAAAAYYAGNHYANCLPRPEDVPNPEQARTCYSAHQSADALWPWDLEWRKPKGSRRDLVRAAALIVAEIERIDRAEIPNR